MFTSSLITLAVAASSVVVAAPFQKRGIATYYQAGLGACGEYNSGSDWIVAIPSSVYGNTGARSGMCGKTITIKNLSNGKTAQATIQDACPSCPDSTSLDMSASLFSYLNNGNMDAGVFPISWWQGGGGGGSSSGTGSGSNNNNNDNNNQQSTSTQQQQQATSTTSSSQSSSTASASSSTSTSSKPKQSPYSATPVDSGANAPSGKVSSNITSTPSWWATIDPAYCNLKVPSNVSVVAVGPTKYYNGTNLSDACGKWVDITNPANNKTIQALVTEWVPEMEINFIALTDGYKKLADMQGETPNPIANVTWGFIQNATKSDN